MNGSTAMKNLMQAFGAGLLLASGFALHAEVPQADAATRSQEPNTLLPPGVQRYAPSPLPDRIVALPAQDGGRGFSVSWRTNTAVREPLLEISPASDSPDAWAEHGAPRQLRASTHELLAGNGLAHHHQVRVDGLEPGRLYAWRVQGDRSWSPWRQLRTAAAPGTPLEFVYLGDTQNKNASLGTHVAYEAVRFAPDADLVLFAGDLVSEAVDDDEWGEWFDATAPLARMLFAPAAGNHEFYKEHEDTEQERRVLGPQWRSHFALPGNGAPGVEASSYWFDWQGVRFAVVDGTSALDLGAAPAQARWLDQVLADNPQRWSIVLLHQPVYSPRAGRDNRLLREHLQPVLERHTVDLVLQGHDHTYGRRGGDDPQRATPQYIVSVAGAKQYRLSDQARRSMAPVAEDTQLFQVIRIEGDVLSYRAHTVTGQLYDAFELRRDGAAGTTLHEQPEGRIAPRDCGREATLGGRRDRCWE